MDTNLTEIHLKIDDPDDYYIGTVVKKTPKITILQAIDEDGDQGGTLIFKNDCISNTLTSSDNITFYQYMITRKMVKDPFNLKEKNAQFLEQNFDDFFAILTYLIKNKEIASVIATDGFTYTGLFTKIDKNEVRLKEKTADYQLETFETVIPLAKIGAIDLNVPDTLVFNDWLKQDKKEANDLNLVEIFLSYDDDDRNGEFITGKILAKNKNNLLVETYNDLGQVDSISVLQYSKITHIASEDSFLDYLAYLIKRNEKAGTVDPYALTQMWKMDTTICNLDNVPTIKQLLKWKQSSKILIDVDSSNYTTDNLGIITHADDQTVTQKVIDGYQLTDERTYAYQDIDLVTLYSREILQMQLFFDENKK